MARHKVTDDLNQRARDALVELLEQMRDKSRIYARNMAKLSIDAGKTGPVYGMFVAGKMGLEPETVRRICQLLKASAKQTRAASFLLVACKWPDQIVASVMLDLSGSDVDRLIDAGRARAARARGGDHIPVGARREQRRSPPGVSLARMNLSR